MKEELKSLGFDDIQIRKILGLLEHVEIIKISGDVSKVDELVLSYKCFTKEDNQTNVELEIYYSGVNLMIKQV